MFQELIQKSAGRTTQRSSSHLRGISQPWSLTAAETATATKNISRTNTTTHNWVSPQELAAYKALNAGYLPVLPVAGYDPRAALPPSNPYAHAYPYSTPPES